MDRDKSFSHYPIIFEAIMLGQAQLLWISGSNIINSMKLVKYLQSTLNTVYDLQP